MRKTLTYIAHPYSTHGHPAENFQKVDAICRRILATEPDVIPISPLHTFHFVSPEGDQTQVIQMCLTLLSKCHEARFYGEWQSSSGCQKELAHALFLGIPIRVQPITSNKRSENS